MLRGAKSLVSGRTRLRFGTTTKYKRKRRVYIFATLLAMAIFLPLHRQPWAIYAGVLAGYTVLVFGLRRIESSLKSSEPGSEFSSGILLTHATYSGIVVGWIWLCVALRPHLPYFLTSEDTSRPYYGLTFLGLVGLLLLEMMEQKSLRKVNDSLLSIPHGNSTDTGGN